MELAWWVVLLSGVLLLFRATRSFCAFPVVYYWQLVPSAWFAGPAVLPLLALSAFAKGVGALCTNGLLRYRPRLELSAFRKKPLQNLMGSRSVFSYALFVCLVLTIFLVAYYFRTVGISVLMEDPAHARLLAKDNIQGWFVFQRFLRIMFPLLIMIYFLGGLRRGRRSYVVASVLTLLCAVLIVFTGFRGNVGLFIFYPFAMLAGLLNRQASRRIVWGLGTLTALSALAINLLMKPEEGLIDVLTELWSRVMTTGFDGITFVVEDLVPRRGFFDGSTFLDDALSMLYRAGLSSSESYNFSAYVAKELLGDRYINEQAGVGAEGELYANFGFAGIVLGAFLMGAVSQVLYVRTVRAEKDVVMTPVFVELHLMLVIASGGPLLGTFLDYSITVTAMASLFIGLYLFLAMPSGRTHLWWPTRKRRQCLM